jgi:pyruvate,water dikinase
MNMSLAASMMLALGFSRERINYESEEFFGNLPGHLEVPVIPFSRWAVLRKFAPFALRAMVKKVRNRRQLTEFTAALPVKAATLRELIWTVDSASELALIWESSLEPLLRLAYQMLATGTSKYENLYRPLRHKLIAQAGETDTNLLLSSVSTAGERLESLGPLIGLWQVKRGALSHAGFLQRYGHRGPHEMEVSWPRPAEDAQWLEWQLQALDGQDVMAMLTRREAEKEEAWKRYEQRYPREAAKTSQAISRAAAAARGREAIRSEVVRLYGIVREFALRAGVLTGLGDDVFFIWLEELMPILWGLGQPDDRAIAVRREAHKRYQALPSYPAIIRGRFNPVTWAASDNHHAGYFDAQGNSQVMNGDATEIISGLPASAGIVEGVVRRLDSLKEAGEFMPGEILVARTTNVGWTPLFPRAAAVVTDVGAPLSHAAIVARELGIPAVVGTTRATTWLRTGDRVRVDGARGTVERLRS